jgi:hypothetical protein
MADTLHRRGAAGIDATADWTGLAGCAVFTPVPCLPWPAARDQPA